MEPTLINPDLQINKPGPENEYELRGAVEVDSDKSTGEETELHRPLEMEKGAENELEVNSSVAANDVALSQSNERPVNQIGAVGINSNKSKVEEITEMLKLLKMEEGSHGNLQVNKSDVANDVALSQSDDLLIAVSSSSTLVADRSSGSLNNFELRGVVGVDSDISSGEETKQTPMVLEMEESAEKDLEVNGLGVTNMVTLSEVGDLLINQVGAVETESDTSIGEDIEGTSGSDHEMEESAEKDDVNLGAANRVTLFQVSDPLINQVEALGTEIDTSIGEDINETNAGKDYEVNVSGATNMVTLSQVGDLLINQVRAVGTESDTSVGEDIEGKSAGNDYEMEESAEKDDVNGSGATNRVTLSQVSDPLINQVEAVGTEIDTSIGEDSNETNAGKDYEVNVSGATNVVTLSQVGDLLINQVGAVGTESDTSIGEDIVGKSAGNDYEMEESAEKDDVNGSGAANRVTLSQVSDPLINQVEAVGTEIDTSIGEDINETNAGKDYEVNVSGATNMVTLSEVGDLLINQVGAVGTESDTSIGKDIENDYEMEESTEKDDVNGSGPTNRVTLSQVSEPLINQVDAVGTESDTSIGEDIEGKSAGNDYEMEESAEKDDVNGSGAANRVTLSQVSDPLINQVEAVGTEIDTSIGEDINETNAGKDYDVNVSGATNMVTLSEVGDLLINQVGAVGTESDTSIGKDIENDYEMEESAEKDDVNGSGATNRVTLSQVSEPPINQVDAVGTESDTSIGEDIEGKSAGNDYEMEESAEKDDVNGSGAANRVTLSQVSDPLTNQVEAVGTEIDTPIGEDINETNAGKVYKVNVSGATNMVTLSQVGVGDLLINQVGAVGTESDTSIGEDIEGKTAGNDYEMEESAEKDDVNGSGAPNRVTLSQVSEPLINQVDAVGTEIDTSIGEDINETNAGKDYEVNVSVAISHSDDIVINHLEAVGIEFNKTTDGEIKDMAEFFAMEKSSGNDLETDISISNNDVAFSKSNDLFIAVSSSSTITEDKSSDEDIKQPEQLDMEESAEKYSEMNRSCAANNVALFLSDDLLINQIGADGIDSNKSAIEEIKEKPELTEEEESVGNDIEANISVAENDVASSPSSDLLIAVPSSSSLADDQYSGEDTEKMPIVMEMEDSARNDYEMEESAEKDLDVNGSGATDSVTLSQVSDLLINQVGAVGTESDTSIGEDIEETSAGNDYEMEESPEKDLDVNGSGAASSATLSQVNDLPINQVGAVGTESNTSIGDDNKETSPGKDYEVNISVTACDDAVSHSDDIMVNHIGAVGIEFNKITDAEIQEMPKLLAVEESSRNDLETNISVANNNIALSQSDDPVFSSSTILKDQSSDEYVKQPELLQMEESAGKHPEMHRSSAANSVALFLSNDLLINKIGADGIDSNKSTIEEIKEKPKLIEVVESFGNDLEANISVTDNDVASSTSSDLLIALPSLSTLSDDQSSGHGNETRPELIEAVENDADKPGSEGTLEMPKLHVTPEPEKPVKNVKFNLRKSLAWDSAFFTSDGVLDADELSTMMEGGVKNAKHQLPGIEEEVYRSMDSISTLESDNLSLECLEAELFEDIRASIQKSNRSSSNLNNSSIKVSSGKKDSQAKVNSSSKKVDIDSGKRPTARMKHVPSSIPQPKIVSRVNPSSTLTLTKRASLSANHAKKDQDIARQPHVIQRGTQAAKTTTQGSKLIVPRRGVPKPVLSSKASPMGSSTALKTEPTRPSSSHSNSSSCSSGTDVKSSTTLSRKQIDSKSSKLTTTSVPKTPSRIIMKNKPQPPANSRLSSHSVLSAMSSSISPASSISEWSSESSSSTTNNNRRSESRGSIETGVSYRSLDSDASGQSALSIPPTGRISNQNGNQPISQSGSLARPPSVQPTGLRMPSPKIGFFDGGKSGARTPNGGNIRPQSKLPTSIPKTGAAPSRPIISNGVKSGKIPQPKTGAAHTNMKPNPQKAKSSDASTVSDGGSRTPFAVKNSEAY